MKQIYKIGFGLILVFILAWLTITSQAIESSPYAKITPENIQLLEFGYALPEWCDFEVFHPNGNLVTAGNFSGISPTIYNAITGKPVLTTTSSLSLVKYSSDGQWIVVENDGLYIYPELTKQYSLPDGAVWFSPNSEYLYVSEHGLYHIKTGHLVLASKGDHALFSAKGTYIAIDGDGIYSIDSLTRLMTLPETAWLIFAFSPDEQLAAIKNDGVYVLSSLEKILTFDSNGYFTFSPDSRYLAATDSGVYDLQTGELIIETFVLGSAFNSTTSSVILSDGVYELTTHEKLFAINVTSFTLSPAEQFVVSEAGVWDVTKGEPAPVSRFPLFLFDDHFAVAGGGVYSTSTWERLAIGPNNGFTPTINRQMTLITYSHYSATTGLTCLLYGIKGNQWPYRSGFVNTDADIDVYSSPTETIGKVGGEMIIFAQTADAQWLKVRLNKDELAFGWIRASDVTPVFMPDGIPVEAFD